MVLRKVVCIVDGLDLGCLVGGVSDVEYFGVC